MTIVFADKIFQAHETGAHPETPRRLAAIDRALAQDQVFTRCAHAAARSVDPSWVKAVHASSVLARAQELADQGGGSLDPDTVLSRDSYDVALKAAGTAVAAVDEVLSGRHANALCLIRPPGHHATKSRSMGFCLFNNVAVAAKYAQAKHGVGRVLIVDWDVHHGNGTQDVFYDTDAVTFFSIHRFPFYPGTGAEGETGTGKGLGATINVPVAFGTSRAKYLEMFQAGLVKAASRAKPDLVIISAGFDAHAADPIGNLGLATEDFATLTRLVRDVADLYCDGRIVSCLEGGYDLTALGDSVAAHLGAYHS